ncbi:hypothetical protein [Dankookia sp. P2]|uniref:hypothetical protein n=1 Tax=Dankookia sp. P2 TaxID=3423955 RepID=UPI003D677D96
MGDAHGQPWLRQRRHPRRRRGPPPRLYVIARRSPFPWLRVRRLDAADRAALRAHLGRLAAAGLAGGLPVPDPAGIAALCAAVDFTRLVAYGAFAGNAVVALACAVPERRGPEVIATEEADYRGRDLGAMLASQVRGAGPGGMASAPCPVEAEPGLLRLLRAVGCRAGQDAAPDLALAQTA